MFTFIAFVLTMAGSINWLAIGLLQYDYIAGFFGFQASIFSRIFYILFGIGAVYLAVRVLVNKGTVKVFERKKKQRVANVEAAKEPAVPKQQSDEKTSGESDELFDEHFESKE